MLIECLIIGICCLPIFILVRNKPPTAPSYAATVKQETQFLKGLKELFKNWNFVIVFYNYGIMFGVFKSFGVVCSYLLTKITSLQVALVQIAPIITGFPAVILSGHIIKKYRIYKIMIILAFIASGALTFTLYFIFREK